MIADVGLLAAKVGDDAVEGYHISVGGGAGDDQALAREIYRDVVAAAVPETVERMLDTYLEGRKGGESFQAFAKRHSVDELKQLFDATSAARAA
jgi:ferredoxin-nitrite reductase